MSKTPCIKYIENFLIAVLISISARHVISATAKWRGDLKSSRMQLGEFRRYKNYERKTGKDKEALLQQDII
jgi:hypothetical protein